MSSFSRRIIVAGIAAASCLTVVATPAFAGVHTWRSWQVFTNPDGTIQFVAIKEALGGAGETGTSSFDVISLPSAAAFDMPGVTAPTNNRYFLLGTVAFQALPGAPPVDGTIPATFVEVLTDTSLRSYTGSTDASWAAGTIPTNGIDMLQRLGPTAGTMGVVGNVATNYAGVTGCVDASGAAPIVLPGVPDGSSGSSPLIVGKSGSDLTLTFDTTTCTDTFDHQIIYGQRNGFPARAGGLYTLTGGVCSAGTTSPINWTGVPTASDPIENSRLTWFFVVTHDGAGTQGPWGKWNNSAFERNGAGPRCASNVCAMTSKSAYGTACGH